jgi:ribonuclease D
VVIEKAAELAVLCSDLQGARALYVDTEFVGEGRYFPEIGAIQVAANGQAVLIDALALAELTPLFDLLLDPEVEKVFHAGYQDLRLLFGLMGRPVASVFDVQIAAALLGYGDQISLADLASRITKEKPRKSHAFADLLRRPLTDSQVEYALDDVRCLQPLHDHLLRELIASKRLMWARQDFEALEDASVFLPEDPREVFRKIRGVDRLRGDELIRLRELAAWREETARERNLPPRRICIDPVLMELAQRPKSTVAALSGVRGLSEGQVRRFGRGLLEALGRGAGQPRPALTRAPILPQEMAPTVDFLLLCLRSLAADMQISPLRLANRADVTALALQGERAPVPLLRGWRREAVGEALLAILQGKAAAHISPDTQRVHLEWKEEA